MDFISFFKLLISSLNFSIEISNGVKPWLERDRVAINIPRRTPPRTAASDTVKTENEQKINKSLAAKFIQPNWKEIKYE